MINLLKFMWGNPDPRESQAIEPFWDVLSSNKSH